MTENDNTKNPIKTIDADLQQKLNDYKEKQDLSLSMIAKQLGYSDSQVSRYLAGKFEGNVVAFESKVSDLLKSVAMREGETGDVATFETIVTKQVNNSFEMLRRVQRIGLVSGNAGIGKTRAMELYTINNPLTLMITLSRFSGGSVRAIERALWSAVDTSSYKMLRDGSRGQFLMERLRNSGRLIAVDNAQRLSKRGLEWLFDFHDATRCPIALVGNPEVLDEIRKNDQQFSRISLHTKADLKKTTSDVAMEMLAKIWPAAADELRDVACQVAAQHGHLRALAIEIYTAMDFVKKKPSLSPLEAFTIAHEKLVRNYRLA